MDGIGKWLQELGLAEYAERFVENDIDASVLPDLTDQDLKDLGVASLGHRRKLLRAIADLNQPTPLASPRPAARQDQPPSGQLAERRHLTVMFCDLVESTQLASKLDPEDLREVLGGYHRTVEEAVKRHGGFVAKFMGDGVLAYFGYPQAHEDDAERAVRAGLALIGAAAGLASSPPLRVRIGIATGVAVVGDLLGTGSAREESVVGETPNLAARLQALAEPNALVISESTHRLIGSLFEYRDLGLITLKGFTVLQRAFQVLGASAVESRFEALRSTTLSPLVGREEELDLLLRRWEQVKRGEGRVVLLSGEAGIGKSRLIEALQDRLRDEPHTRLRFFSLPHHEDSPFHSTIAQLERAAGLAADDDRTAKLNKLEALLTPAAPPPEDLRLVAELLSIPMGDRYPPLNLPAPRKKEKTFEALLRQLEALARRRPVLMVFEDVHWMDPTSRELLDLTVNRVTSLPVLLLITYRPEFQPPWIGQSDVSSMVLSRLGRLDGTSLVERIAGNSALPPTTIQEIVERTDGVPLFVEEMTRAVLEAGTDPSVVPSARLAVPPTLHASLMARLDRLGPAVKEVAQSGSVIGREFSYELLAAITPLSETRNAALDQLAQAGLIFRRGAPPNATYLFKHALVQDAAYGTLLRGRRQQLHGEVARAIEERFPDRAEAQPELIAHHLTEAGKTEPAIQAWLKAGRKNVVSMRIEAAIQLRRGIGLVASLPEGSERWRQELELQTLLGRTMAAIKGFPARETGEAYARARELCEQLGDTAALAPVLAGQSAHHCLRSEFSLARRYGEDLMKLAEASHDVDALVMGHRNMGVCLYSLGEQSAARQHFEQALDLYDPDKHQSAQLGAAMEARAHALSVLSHVLFILGYPDQALARQEEALARSRQINHVYTLHTALTYAGVFYVWRRDEKSAMATLEEGIAVVADHGNPMWLAWTDVVRGHLLCKRGERDVGLGLAQKGLDGLVRMGATVYMTALLAWVAESNTTAGNNAEALKLFNEALERVESTGERVVEAELYRLKGDFLLALDPGNTTDALACYQKGLNVARDQQTKSWELRCTMSLARLMRDQGRRADARDLLAPIYGWFTEGFDTPDLMDAKALLDDLK